MELKFELIRNYTVADAMRHIKEAITDCDVKAMELRFVTLAEIIKGDDSMYDILPEDLQAKPKSDS